MLTVNPDGTLHDDGGFPGRWTQSGANITMNFDIGTFYTGRISNGVVSGTYGGGGEGTFTGLRGSNAAASQTTNANSLVGSWDTSSPNEPGGPCSPSMLTAQSGTTTELHWPLDAKRRPHHHQSRCWHRVPWTPAQRLGQRHLSGGGDGDFVMRRR